MCLRSGLNPQSYGHEAVTLPLSHSGKGANPKKSTLTFLASVNIMVSGWITVHENCDDPN